jgi:hypothetical protein
MANTDLPGIHINEIAGLSGGVAPVATAVPAFIGYTPRADRGGTSCIGTPVRIASFEEFRALFLPPDPPAPADPARMHPTQYYLVPQAAEPRVGTSLWVDGTRVAVLPDPGTVYHLCNSIRLFFLNGGSAAWIVSVGTYGAPTGAPLSAPDALLINPNIALHALLDGLASLADENEPTLYVCPDAVLLSQQENSTLMQAMLAQAKRMGTAICLFDVINGDRPDPTGYIDDIANFRNRVGTAALDVGAAYYPFIGTTVLSQDALDFTHLFGGDIAPLAALLAPEAGAAPAVQAALDAIRTPAVPPLPDSVLQRNLLAASPTYGEIMTAVLDVANLLPASGAMAGVYATNDANQGVWVAPANLGIIGAVSLPIRLTDSQQAGLNVDAATGKSINAIREFNGVGLLIWGARTLDGNSQDWRYIQVRRTVIYIEQSIKAILQSFVFEANDARTWMACQATISNFLDGLWRQGALQGASPSAAYHVAVGLGTTMTSQDILDGFMRAQVMVAIVHPAEFIVLTLEQQMAQP